MPLMESAITSKGQATIPKAIRSRLHLAPGDRIKFFLHPDGSVVILPKLPVSALRGMVRGLKGPVTLDRMSDAAAEGATGIRRRKKR
jgi:antitoxin PrlF